jgi:hypothetical protein
MAVDSGSYTPEQIARRRAIAEAMLAPGKTRQITHWAEGLDELGKGALGGYQMRRADDMDRERRAADNKVLEALMGGGQTASAPAAAPVGNAGVNPMGALPQMPNAAPGKIYGNDEASPLDPPSGDDRDRAIRTIIAEAGNQGPTGMNAVGSVIRNRAVGGGATPTQVVMAQNQFEPWNTAGGRSKMAAIDPNSPQYQSADQALTSAYAGNDPTNGATNFYAPKAQAALGRQAPAWDNGSGVDIGDHRFFGGANAPVAAALSGPQAAPQGQGGLLANATPQQRAAIVAGMSASPGSPARAIATALMQQLAKPQEYSYQTLPDGTILRMDPRGGPPQPVYQGATKPTFGDTGEIDPATGQPVKGWINPANQSVTPYRPQNSTAATSTIPAPPPGVDPKVWREAQSKRAAEEGMPASSEAASKLRNEVQGLPSYKNLAQAAPVYKSMAEAAGRDNRAADVNLIYGMAKIMDPGSVVRESEMTVAQAIATLPQQLQAALKSQMTETGRLTPELRGMIMQEARSRILAYQGMFDQDAGMYRGIAGRNRMNEADVLPTFGPFDEYKPAPPQAAPGATPAATAAKPSSAGVIEIDGYKIRAR